MKRTIHEYSNAITHAFLVCAMSIILFALFQFHSSLHASQSTEKRREAHAVWAHPADAGKSAATVRQFVEQCKRANIDTIVMLVKGMSGETYWKSRRFQQTIARGYESFDLLEHLTKETHAQNIKVDAWLCDFVEGVNGAAYREHPEWAQVNPAGGTTATETLGVARRPYPYVWMCPARRPGYTDGWLLPMIEEIVSNYPVDNVHHDYVRYPGDVAPDSYCVCDYCLKELPRFAMLSYETRSAERYRVNAVQEHIEANWWSDPTMVPIDWAQRDRREKADYLLNGRSVPGGPADMSYYFYAYRVRQIDRFVRDAWERVQQINKTKGTKTGISAAVFKNPVQSGRFIGQQWDEWAPWISVFMPMTYRSHFAGSFDAYLEHLTETTARQLEWIGNEKPLYAGIATTYLFREEWQPVDDIRERTVELKALDSKASLARSEKANAIRASYDVLRVRLSAIAPDRDRDLKQKIDAIAVESSTNDPAALDALLKVITELRNNPPAGYLPAEKLTKSIEAARKAKPDGIVIFVAGTLTREKLWPTLEAAFRE